MSPVTSPRPRGATSDDPLAWRLTTGHQSWRRLLFAHAPIEPEALRPLVPEPLVHYAPGVDLSILAPRIAFA